MTASPIFFKLCEIKVSPCTKKRQRHTTHYSETLEKTAIIREKKIFEIYNVPYL